MKVAYIQSIGGASGDMLLGALIDAGLSLDALQEALSLLNVGGYQLSATIERRCEVRGTKLSVGLEGSRRFSPRQFLGTVEDSALPDQVKSASTQVLHRLWQAEARVHGEDAGDLELEELGTVDTLVDVVGFAWGIHQLGIEQIFAGPLVLGASTPPRRAGGYSNPAPATLELAAMAGAPVSPELAIHEGAGELTTPTGAAIITSLAKFQRPSMTIDRIGVGLGGKDPEAFPNVLRLWLGETVEAFASVGEPAAKLQQGIVLLETNLDDATGEVLGYVQERLFDLGALDVWHTPIQMKKNRPGIVLSVLLPERLEKAGAELILRETPTLGVRRRPVERYATDRNTVRMETALGPVRIKLKYLAGTIVAAAPEYEDCRALALESGKPLQDVYRLAESQARGEYLL